MTFTLEDAIITATTAHKGQLDKAGQPYVLHPLRVMFRFPDYMVRHRMVAVMHDVIEDTDVTAEDLLRRGCDAEVVQDLVLLTHVGNEPRKDYITRIVQNSARARDVKIEDIADNSSYERLVRLPEADQERLRTKYRADLTILEGRSV